MMTSQLLGAITIHANIELLHFDVADVIWGQIGQYIVKNIENSYKNHF